MILNCGTATGQLHAGDSEINPVTEPFLSSFDPDNDQVSDPELAQYRWLWQNGKDQPWGCTNRDKSIIHLSSGHIRRTTQGKSRSRYRN